MLDFSTNWVVPVKEPGPGEITQLLDAWSGGDRQALEKLTPLIYDGLRAVAARQLRGERSGHTLQTTDLVHEAFLKLLAQDQAAWRNRSQFFAIAARLMRRLLIDHARRLQAAKRGGGAVRVTLVDFASPPSHGVEVLALDEALTRLDGIDPRQGRIVELRFFAGMSVEEVAQVLDVSPTTVKREWRLAQVWLRGELLGQADGR